MPGEPKSRRFPPPRNAVRTRGGFMVVDANDFALAYIYSSEHPHLSYTGLTIEQAKTIAKNIAKLPTLLAQQTEGNRS